jgi:hypothetical protein
MTQEKFYNFVDNIIAYESGELNNSQCLELFSELLKSKTIYSLQGSYQRPAKALIDNGFLSVTGDILKDIE